MFIRIFMLLILPMVGVGIPIGAVAAPPNAVAPLSSDASIRTETNRMSSMAVIDKAAPKFELPDYKGDKHSLSDYKGKFVVLEWINFDCPFSRKHYESGNMPDLQKEYTKKGVIWLSINSSAPGKQGNFTREKINEELKAYRAKPTSYLVDSEGRVGHLYGAKTTPTMYVINPQGILIYKGAIDDKPTFDKDDILGARNYVKDALDEAMEGKPVKIAQTKSYGCSVKYGPY